MGDGIERSQFRRVAKYALAQLFALQYADDVEVLDPPSLRDEIAKTLKAAANKYQ